MVVIGIDFGNDSCVVSVWRNGRIDIVTNEFNCRYTPSVVAFDERKRIFGVSAKKQWITNADNTIVDFKRVLDVNMKKKWEYELCTFTKKPRHSTLSVDVNIMGENFNFSPCQVLAMLFKKIKDEAQTFMQTNERILECVISVPAHFNDQERKGVLMAAAIARLDCRFLIKDTTAVAINYSHYKKFSKPINVVFVDFGQSSVQISICRFFERRLEVIEEASDLIGGRDIDEAIADFLITMYKICGANTNNKTFCAQLLHEVEQLKKKMSSSVQPHELLTFKDAFTGNSIFMSRSQMERVCCSLFMKIENVMRLCLERSKLKIDEIHSIELVGGSSNIPIVQKMVKNIFDKVPIATMNRDEAVARGCLLKSMLHAKRRGYKIVEKPFADAVENFDVRGMKDLVRIFQVHRYLKCDRHDSFEITEKEFMAYVEMERKLSRMDVEDAKRQIARNDLDNYLVEHMKPGGVLENCTQAIRNEINKTRVWDFGTRDQYVDLLYYWTQKVEKLSKINVIRHVEEDSANDMVCVTTCRKENRCCASQVFVKRLTFNDCDEVTLIESNQSSSTSSEYDPREHRKGFRSRYRRLKRNVRQSRDAVFVNVDESQALLCRQRKKGVPWCCVL